MANPRVAVLMGSDSDLPKLEGTFDTLRELGLEFTADVISAHRTPAAAHRFAASAEEKGYEVIIAAAGGAAHLAGVLASQTALPIIGVPIPTSNLGGLDSLLSTVQMPGGVPVATVGVGSGGAKNAAVLAAQIIAVGDPDLRARLKAFKEKQADEVAEKSRRLKEKVEG